MSITEPLTQILDQAPLPFNLEELRGYTLSSTVVGAAPGDSPGQLIFTIFGGKRRSLLTVERCPQCGVWTTARTLLSTHVGDDRCRRWTKTQALMASDRVMAYPASWSIKPKSPKHVRAAKVRAKQPRTPSMPDMVSVPLAGYGPGDSMAMFQTIFPHSVPTEAIEPTLQWLHLTEELLAAAKLVKR